MAEQNAKYLNKCRLLRVFEYMQNTDEQHPLNITQIIAKLLEDGVCDREPDRKSICRLLKRAVTSWKPVKTITMASI